MASNADTPRARALGAELRRAREQKGLSTRELGALVERHASHISRWEHGRIAPSAEDTATMLAHLGVTGGERERLLELAREASDPDWLAPGTNRQLALLAEYERTAHAITCVEPLLIPGLLQTPDYARTITATFGATRGEAEQLTMIRMGRQRVVADAKASLTAIVGEYALRYSPCGALVMLEQLQHLAKMSNLDNVVLHVLPLNHTAASALTGPWVLIEFDHAKPVIHLEHYDVTATITDQKAVAEYQAAAAHLPRVAMSPAQSTQLIADIIEQME